MASKGATNRKEELKQTRTQAKVRPSPQLGEPFQETFGLFQKSESYDIEDDEAPASKQMPNSFPAEERQSMANSGP